MGSLTADATAAWGQWISAAPWDLIVTFTDARSLHPEAMLKRARYFEGLVNDDLYGKHWRRHGKGVESVTALERQKRGAIHSHALWRLPDHNARDGVSFPLDHWRAVARRVGGKTGTATDVSFVRSSEDVSSYVSKYVVKGGELVLSSTFNPNAPRTFTDTLLSAAER